MVVSFFFFKQKTAYEMRISDWSSDVCSSDLGSVDINLAAMDIRNDYAAEHVLMLSANFTWGQLFVAGSQRDLCHYVQAARCASPISRMAAIFALKGRSEEPTSELQSLMRIPYAVFCLHKKNNHIHEHNTIQI